MSRSKYLKKHRVQAAQLARQGLKNAAIAKALGVTPLTFNNWIARHADLKKALIKARKTGQVNVATKKSKSTMMPVATFKEYVYHRMDQKTRDVWDKISRFDESDSAELKIDALLEEHGELMRQNIFIHAWIASGFRFAQACRRACVSYRVFRRWKEDPDFMELINEIDFHKKNLFEESLIDLVMVRDPNVVLYVNKTYNKDRGYGDKMQIGLDADIKSSKSINLNKLSLKARKELLKQLRESDGK